ncbi:MAG: hypothetical protein JSR83_13625 [Proteobacteria bacterium]|nr:hypothetical protein [Pseudomonadota bacterium]
MEIPSSLSSTGGQSLQLVVEISAGIRQVTALSSQVNLVALNAMLAAKQAGSQARGFGIVSSELRQFSGQLDRQMHELGDFIGDLVHSVAESARIRLHVAHLDQIPAAIQPRLAGAAARIEARQARIDSDGSERWFGLGNRLDHALRLCSTGVALSRAAKIEAVYGQALAASLRQVADEIEDAIVTILGTIKQLRRALAHHAG